MKAKAKKYYQEYIPGQPLSSFFDSDKIPLLQMRHLRDLDFPITRRISYERTVDEFLLQMAVNDVLLPLRNRAEMVILLDAQGALMREDGRWTLLFTPEQEEMLTLAEDAPLYPVLEMLLKKESQSLVCRVEVPERSMKALASGLLPFCILDEYCKNQKGGYLSVAEKIVIAGPEELYRHVPVCRYNALATVDKDEVENYHTIRLLMEDYIFRYGTLQDEELLRPLSIAVFGHPGSGKSFGVKQIALSMGHFSLTSLNLSQYDDAEDLFEALDEALQCEKGKIPLIFFDEFDSELNGTARGWLKYFLAPMQDGEYTLDGKLRRIKAAVFVFAGATAFSFHGFLPETSDEEEAFKTIKGPDFVSRLEGILNIKGANPLSPSDRSHIIRRAMLMRGQIIRSSSGIYDETKGLVNISKGMLAALLAVSEYRHGARSLEFILEMSRLSEVSRFTPSCLPVDEQLDIHLDVQDFRKRLSFEQMMGDYLDRYVAIAYRNDCADKAEEAISAMAAEGSSKEDIIKEEEFVSWEELSETERAVYYSQIYNIGVRLQDYKSTIGLRPIMPGAADTINELYGPALEELAAWEHLRWVTELEQEGWRPGIADPEAMTNPEMVAYEELEEPAKEQIRLVVRKLPRNLKELGFELYRRSF
ncbi:MAG: hypothetical protein IJ899_07590 [Blautia sp.]|nr:hypothetical protein [Blautia sp.]